MTFRLVALLVALLWGARADAFPVHRRLFQTRYKGAVRCELCHVSGGGSRRNTYGQAWQKAGESLAAFEAIEDIDSDGDGASNREEIEAASNPGDRESTPGATGARYRRRQAVPIPTAQLLMVFPRVSRIEAMEATLSDQQVRDLEKATDLELSAEDRLPTLYFATEAHKRVAVASFANVSVKGERFTLLIGVNTNGTVRNLALLRAGADEPQIYRPYLNCLKGAQLGRIPSPGSGTCAKMRGHVAEQKALGKAVELTLRTLGLLFKKAA